MTLLQYTKASLTSHKEHVPKERNGFKSIILHTTHTQSIRDSPGRQRHAESQERSSARRQTIGSCRHKEKDMWVTGTNSHAVSIIRCTQGFARSSCCLVVWCVQSRVGRFRFSTNCSVVSFRRHSCARKCQLLQSILDGSNHP